MKRILIIPISLILLLTFSSAVSDSNCDSRTLKKEGIAELDPYFYSASKVNMISYDYKAYKKEIEVPLFKGEKYKMVFNKKGLPKDVLIEVFDKDKSKSGRTPLFTSNGNETSIISYVPEKSKKMYISYTIPPAKGDEEKEGCLVFILGYQLTFIEN